MVDARHVRPVCLRRFRGASVTQEAGIGTGCVCLLSSSGWMWCGRFWVVRVTEVAASVGVSRQTVHSWMTRHLVEGVAGLADRSHRPVSCPHQASAEVEGAGRGDAPEASGVGREADSAGAVARRCRRGGAVGADREPDPCPSGFAGRAAAETEP
ncbi:leucine zipper domain-containing protein [Kribbella sp.]|uniref:leucine zipper domain-containing protein n=1 Tax=Kribbella sp. TaxID=1871183 RepID=UPI0039C8CBFC